MDISNYYVIVLDIGYSLFAVTDESRFVIQTSENVLVYVNKNTFMHCKKTVLKNISSAFSFVIVFLHEKITA